MQNDYQTIKDPSENSDDNSSNNLSDDSSDDSSDEESETLWRWRKGKKNLETISLGSNKNASADIEKERVYRTLNIALDSDLQQRL